MCNDTFMLPTFRHVYRFREYLQNNHHIHSFSENNPKNQNRNTAKCFSVTCVLDCSNLALTCAVDKVPPMCREIDKNLTYARNEINQTALPRLGGDKSSQQFITRRLNFTANEFNMSEY